MTTVRLVFAFSLVEIEGRGNEGRTTTTCALCVSKGDRSWSKRCLSSILPAGHSKNRMLGSPFE